VNTPRSACSDILQHLLAAHERNPQAEVHALEFERELGLDADAVRSCLQELVAEGAVEADLTLVNVWVRLAGSEPPPLRQFRPDDGLEA